MGVVEKYFEMTARVADEQVRAMDRAGMPQGADPGESKKTADMTNQILAEANAEFAQETGE